MGADPFPLGMPWSTLHTATHRRPGCHGATRRRRAWQAFCAICPCLAMRFPCHACNRSGPQANPPTHPQPPSESVTRVPQGIQCTNPGHNINISTYQPTTIIHVILPVSCPGARAMRTKWTRPAPPDQHYGHNPVQYFSSLFIVTHCFPTPITMKMEDLGPWLATGSSRHGHRQQCQYRHCTGYVLHTSSRGDVACADCRNVLASSGHNLPVAAQQPRGPAQKPVHRSTVSLVAADSTLKRYGTSVPLLHPSVLPSSNSSPPPLLHRIVLARTSSSRQRSEPPPLRYADLHPLQLSVVIFEQFQDRSCTNDGVQRYGPEHLAGGRHHTLLALPLLQRSCARKRLGRGLHRC